MCIRDRSTQSTWEFITLDISSKARALKEELEYLWERYCIGSYYCEAFRKCLAYLPLSLYAGELTKEIAEMYQERAIIQRLMRSIGRREELMAQFKKANDHLAKVNLESQATVNFIHLLENLRMETLMSIEYAFQLRLRLKVISQLQIKKDLPIMHKGENYFCRIVEDTCYIHKSELAKVLKLKGSFDLFFLSISQAPLLRSFSARHKLLSKIQAKSCHLTFPIGKLYNLSLIHILTLPTICSV
eukprot:TRINITY_DN20772_c0_g1_i2.p1 TRINITY_DN20772_c0_g1~~TRINITY_DN20772_c0_g1_i2.p1  ORF type:complete len:244 (-),score=36.78 TRINITY_DN20772_c0_g1_i2:34-765(-)